MVYLFYFGGMFMTTGILMKMDNVKGSSILYYIGLMMIAMVVEKFYDKIGNKKEVK